MSEALAAQSFGAVCALHGEAPATGTCARCGRFVCEACAGADRVCPGCLAQRFLEVPSSRGRATAARAFLFAAAGSEGLTMLSHAWGLAQGERTFGQLAMDAVGSLGIFFAFIGGAIALLMWLHRAVRQVIARGGDVGASPRWAVGMWFVPFLSLVLPYVLMRSLLREVAGEARPDVRAGTWWGAFIAGNLAGGAESSLAFQASQDGQTFAVPYAVGIASSLLLILAALLCAGMVKSVQQRLDAQRAADRAQK